MNSVPPTHGYVGEALLEKPHNDELDQTWSEWALLTEDLMGKTKQPNAIALNPPKAEPLNPRVFPLRQEGVWQIDQEQSSVSTVFVPAVEVTTEQYTT